MAGSLNKAMIIGNVGRDPELRYTPSGAAVANFSVATSQRFQRDGQTEEKTEWHNIVCWNKLAETANQILSKGRKVYIEGRIESRSWEGQDGQKRYRTEIIASTFVALDRRPDGAGAEAGDDSADGEVL